MRYLTEPKNWVLYLCETQPARLVVFVHGFRGQAVGSWQHFPDGGAERDWWQQSDLLFVDYPSSKDNPQATAGRLRRHLPDFYPDLPTQLLEVGRVRVREAADTPYEELLLVGHSLGGVIVRRALCETAEAWLDDLKTNPSAPKPRLLDAQVRLFSPASAGFRAAGFLGMVQASSFWKAVNMQLRRSSAYTELQPHSDFLSKTQERTEALVTDSGSEFGSLKAHIAWANPDNVVLPERYETDHKPDEPVDGTTHSSVCKPTVRYELPWTFVETGRIR